MVTDLVALIFRCKIPGYDNDTYLEQNENHRQLINWSIPLPEDTHSVLKYDRCHVIQRDESNVTRLVKCSEWVYDRSVFEETFTSKVSTDDNRVILTF